MSGLRTALQDIYDEAGYLTPALVVDEARSKSHSLHDRFEWDNRVAGERYRHQQAHELIRSQRIVYREADDAGPEKSVRSYHAVRSEDGHVYRSTDDVIADDVSRQVLLRDMEREWQQLKRRYDGFREFLDLVKRDVA